MPECPGGREGERGPDRRLPDSRGGLPQRLLEEPAEEGPGVPLEDLRAEADADGGGELFDVAAIASAWASTGADSDSARPRARLRLPRNSASAGVVAPSVPATWTAIS